jgi:transcriptional regulator with XRE-family HTH domain
MSSTLICTSALPPCILRPLVTISVAHLPMIKPGNKTFGALIKELREGKKLSLREMEDKSGISNAYISQVENGQIKRPSPNFLHKMSEVLDYPYELLMERAGHVVPNPRTAQNRSRRKGSDEKQKAFAIFSTIKDLTEEEAEALLEFLNWRRSRQSKNPT